MNVDQLLQDNEDLTLRNQALEESNTLRYDLIMRIQDQNNIFRRQYQEAMQLSKIALCKSVAAMDQRDAAYADVDRLERMINE